MGKMRRAGQGALARAGLRPHALRLIAAGLLIGLLAAGPLSLASPGAALAAGSGGEAGSSAGGSGAAAAAPASKGDATPTSEVDAASAAGGSDALATASGSERDAAPTAGSASDAASFELSDPVRLQVGSARAIDGVDHGYAFALGAAPREVVLIASADRVFAYVDPEAARRVGADAADDAFRAALRERLSALDAALARGGAAIPEDAAWTWLDAPRVEAGGLALSINEGLASGGTYAFVADAATGSAPEGFAAHALIADLAASGQGSAASAAGGGPGAGEDGSPDGAGSAPEGLSRLGAFLAGVDLSPLWVTLKTTLTATALVFVLGLAAAYLCLRISPRVRDLLDSLFTIPMVLPPTVMGFILLLALNRTTPLGSWFAEHGFPLVFSWPATVIAAVVVAFPLMYRSARGAFESIEPNMLDAARTLGWGEGRIFLGIMLPLAMPSIASGVVLAFARALGEFGATLFLAGNYLGITRTIPIAIYFEWMNGNTDVALFWTLVILAVSFVVILFINLWSRRNQRFRKRGQ